MFGLARRITVVAMLATALALSAGCENTNAVDSGTSDGSMVDTGTSDSGKSDGSMPDLAKSDGSTVDLAKSDGGPADGSSDDGGSPDLAKPMDVCGDGQVTGAEKCDDDGMMPGDGCDENCQLEPGWTCAGTPSVCITSCGDGIVAGVEKCDDKGSMPGDGCDGSCQPEAGWTCTGAPSTCVTQCNDGIVAGMELCDDHGSIPGDGCDGNCQPEVGWTCTGTPSVCTTTCGDGIKAGVEQCDDGKSAPFDGCNASCKIDVFNETEPNNSAAQANGPFTYDVLVHASVKPGTDSDWFAIQVPATADLTIESFDAGGPGRCDNIDTVITFYAPDGKTVLATDDDGGVDRCSRLASTKNAALRHLPAGTYYALVTAYAGYKPIAGYSLAIKFDALCGDGKKAGFEQCDGAAGCTATCDRVPSCGDGFVDGGEKCDDGNMMSGDGCSQMCVWETLVEAEANDTAATASGPHKPGVLFGGAISPASDVDYYSITVPATADLRIETFDSTGPGSCIDIDTEVTLYGTDGTTVLVGRDQGGLGNCSRIDPALPSDQGATRLPAGTYYVAVKSHAGATAIPGYTLLVTYAALCGNGAVEGTEACDGTAGCTATCSRTPMCGDGFVDGAETCDDGNMTPGDGCSGACMLELVSESESNDTPATSNGPFSTFTLLQGAIASGPDVDYFAVTVAATSDLKIQTFDGRGACDSIDPVLTLFGTDGTTVLATNDDGGGDANWHCSLLDPKFDAGVRHLAPGTYFVKVEDFKNNNAIPAYRLAISFTAVCGNGQVEGFEECDGTANCDASCSRIPTCGDGFIDAPETCEDGNMTPGDGCSAACQLETIAEAEPNDNPSSADASSVMLSGAATLSGSIATVGDKDFFRLTLAAGGTYRFETLDSSGADCTIATTLRLWDGVGAQIASDDTSGISSCSALTLTLAAGTYYVSVEQQGNVAAIPAYLLAIRAEADGGAETEPNDTVMQASGLPGAEVFAIGDHSQNTDTDFFAINVPAGKSVRAELVEGDSSKTCDSLGIDSALTLYDAQGIIVATDDDAGRGFCSLIDGTGSAPVNAGAHALAGGMYYLAVEAAPFSQDPSNTDGQFKYRLVVTIR